MKKTFIILIMPFFTTCFSTAQPVERWHQFALTIDAGLAVMPVELTSIGSYAGKQLDGAMETRLSFLSVLTPDLILSTSLSKLKTSATLPNTNPAYSLNYLDVDIDLMTLWLTLQYYPPQRQTRSIAMWYGGGLHAGTVEQGLRARLYVPNAGYYREEKLSSSTALAGAHLSAGLNIYPHEQSAICFTAEGRINLTGAGSDLGGSLISTTLLLGLRWDFGLNPN